MLIGLANKDACCPIPGADEELESGTLAVAIVRDPDGYEPFGSDSESGLVPLSLNWWRNMLQLEALLLHASRNVSRPSRMASTVNVFFFSLSAPC